MLNRSFKSSETSPGGSPVQAHVKQEKGFTSKNPFESGEPFYADDDTSSGGLPQGWVVCEHCWLCGPLTYEATHPTDECPAKIALENEPPLHRACRYGNEDIVRRLIETKADMRKLDLTKRTALQVAVQYKKQDIAWLLLEHGAADPEEGAASASEVRFWQNKSRAKAVCLSVLGRLRVEEERRMRLTLGNWMQRTRQHKQEAVEAEAARIKEVTHTHRAQKKSPHFCLTY